VSRRRFFWAGLVAGFFVALKFEVAWPVAIFLPILLWHDRQALKHAFAGELLAGALCLVGPMLWLRSWPVEWLHKLEGFTRSIAHIQPDPAGLGGLLRLLPSDWHISPGLHDPITWVLVLICLVGFLLLGRLLLSGQIELDARERLCVGLGAPLVLWSLCSPYGHSDDTLILLPMVLLLLGASWRGLADGWVWGLCAALAILPGYTLLSLLVLGPSANNLSFTALGTLWLSFLVGRELFARQGSHQVALSQRQRDSLQPTRRLDGGPINSPLR
jgi:hypothetical protein